MHAHINYIVQELLNNFEKRIQILEQKVKELESHLHPIVDDRVAFYLTVPDSLRKSLFAVSELSKATADEVCGRTGRHRSIENKYLNELVREGWLKRERIGKKIYYSYKNKKEDDYSIPTGIIDELDRKLDEIIG